MIAIAVICLLYITNFTNANPLTFCASNSGDTLCRNTPAYSLVASPSSSFIFFIVELGKIVSSLYTDIISYFCFIAHAGFGISPFVTTSSKF
jgi:hypothetical protein